VLRKGEGNEALGMIQTLQLQLFPNATFRDNQCCVCSRLRNACSREVIYMSKEQFEEIFLPSIVICKTTKIATSIADRQLTEAVY
jgi:hypothetical protein